MPLLALKVVLTPILVAAASLAARRWGPSIGGLLIALPLTSGPVALFLALDQGAPFAAGAVIGSLGGLIAIAGFCVAYAAAGRRAGAGAGVAAACASFACIGFAVRPVTEASPWIVLGLVVVAVVAALAVLPAGLTSAARAAHPWWDLPARMALATALVVTLTSVAPQLGPQASGIVATFPVYLAVLAVFAHRQAGIGAAVEVLRGLLAGLFGTAAFYVVVHEAIGPLGVLPAFGLATAVALAIQAVALRRVRSASGRPIAPEPA